MPITPRFSLTQDDEYIYARISVPHVRVSSAEIEIEGQNFTFFCAPYLLKLTLPGDLLDDERANATYDADKDGGTLLVRAPKAVIGQVFEELDLVTRLLQPPPLFPERSRLEPKESSSSSASNSSSSLDTADNELNQLLMGTSISDTKKRNVLGKEGGSRTRPMIEVISSTEEKTPDLTASTKNDQENSNQRVLLDGSHFLDKDVLNLTKPGYGFNRSFSGFFADLREEIQSGVTSLPEPDSTANETRPALRVIQEEDSWDIRRYCGDLFIGDDPDPFFLEALSFSPFWLKSTEEEKDLQEKCHPWEWTDVEAEELSNLPNREYLIDGKLIGGRLASVLSSSSSSSSVSDVSSLTVSSSVSSLNTDGHFKECFNIRDEPENSRIMSGLISILIGYCYDHRMTCGEPTVESGWTIATLSPLLSWLDDVIDPSVWSDDQSFDEKQKPVSTSLTLLEAVIVACVRRILCYPYIRRWDLAMLALSDCVMILLKGRRAVLRALLAIRRIFKKEDARYLLNKLFLDDLCVWAQAIKSNLGDAVFVELGTSLSVVIQGLSKSSPGLSHWNLETIEAKVIAGEDPLGEEEEEEEEDDDDDDDESSDDEDEE
jgi:protein SHQ1